MVKNRLLEKFDKKIWQGRVGGVTCDGLALALHPGWVAMLLVASCHRNLDNFLVRLYLYLTWRTRWKMRKIWLYTVRRETQEKDHISKLKNIPFTMFGWCPINNLFLIHRILFFRQWRVGQNTCKNNVPSLQGVHGVRILLQSIEWYLVLSEKPSTTGTPDAWCQ